MKCPRCNQECQEVHIQQDFVTTAYGTLYQDGKTDFDLSSGYTLLDEWLNSMLTERGKYKILGCDFCLSK